MESKRKQRVNSIETEIFIRKKVFKKNIVPFHAGKTVASLRGDGETTHANKATEKKPATI